MLSKPKTIFWICAFFLACFARAQQSPTHPLNLTPAKWDFQVIKDDKKISQDFTIANPTDKPVSLTPLPSSCGCVAVFADQPIVAPGKSSTLSVAFTPRGYRGKFQWEVKIATDLPGNPTIVIPLQAYILRDAMLSEDKIDFGIFNKGKAKSKTIWLVCRQHPKFTLKKASCDVKGFDIQFKEVEKIEGFYPHPLRGYRIDISTNDKIVYGKNHGKVDLETHIPGHKEMHVHLLAHAVGEITIAPEYLSFGVIRPGQVQERRILVYHGQKKEFRVLHAKTDLKWLSTRIQTVMPHYYILHAKLACPEGTAPGEFRNLLKVSTDLPEYQEIEVHLQGIVFSPPKKEGPKAVDDGKGENQ